MSGDLKRLDGLLIDPPGKGPFDIVDLVAVKVARPNYGVARVWRSRNYQITHTES
jgi:hypothetical protein